LKTAVVFSVSGGSQGLEDRIEETMRTVLEMGDSEKDWILNFQEQGVKAFRMNNGHYTTLRGTGEIRHHASEPY
jgi:hypothetical protein